MYGALNHRDRPHGGSVRFGSAYLRLRPEVTDRTTFCFPDSVFEPTAIGCPDRLDELVALADAADRLGCPVEWHPGFEAGTATLDEDYRGPEPLALARSLGPVITPAVVGDAARSGRHDPQTVKRVWHLLARFGRR